MSTKEENFNEAAKYLLEVLRAQPQLIHMNKVGASGGKDAGEFIAALHTELQSLIAKRG